MLEVLTLDLPLAGDVESWAERVTETERLSRELAAAQAVARAGFAEALAMRGLAEFAGSELGCLEQCTPSAADTRLRGATTLVGDLPVTLGLLAAGQLTAAAAGVVVDLAETLTHEQCEALESRLWPQGEDTVVSFTSCTPTGLRARAARWLPGILGADGLEHRVAGAREGRQVQLWPGEQGTDTAVVASTLTSPDAAAVMAALDARAAQASADDPRSADARRADALVEAVTGQTSFALWSETGADPAAAGPAPHWTVQVSVGLDVLVAAQQLHGTGDVERLGVVTGETARLLATAALAGGGRVSRLVLDPLSGLLADTTLVERCLAPAIATVVECHYVPSEALARFVRARDRHCQFPGCGIPARRCELDHIERYDHGDPSAGGQTTAVNLTCLCKRHHRAKHAKGWSLRRGPDGLLVWTTPSGLRLTSDPPDARAG